MISSAFELAFRPQKSGRIVNVIAGISRGFPGMVHTGAARAGVDVSWECSLFSFLLFIQRKREEKKKRF
jgi:NAD(P)-dependent dehydrogenase (short-subunit alcohol dehydrogenase family)